MQSSKIYTIDEIKEILQNNKTYLEEKFFVEKFFLFGSYAKNQQTAKSDIDLLVSFKQPVDFIAFVDLQDFISELFKKKIDLGTLGSLKEFVKDSILKEAIAL